MARIIIRPRLNKAAATKLIKNFGGILSGKEIDAYGVRDVFFGTMAFHLYSKMYQAFLQKSVGGSDDLGESWLPLSESTIKRRVSAWFTAKHPLSADLQINRVDDTLLNSLKPGTFSGTYTPSPNQYFNYQRGNLHLGSSLNYASYVHAKRPLWPDDMTPWVSEAISKAIEATILHIKRLVE